MIHHRRWLSSTARKSSRPTERSEFTSRWTYLKAMVFSPSVRYHAKEVQEAVQWIASPDHFQQKKVESHQAAVLLLAGHQINDFKLILDTVKQFEQHKIDYSPLGSKLASIAALECRKPTVFDGLQSLFRLESKDQEKTRLQLDLLQQFTQVNYPEPAKSLYHELRSQNVKLSKSVYEDMVHMFVKLRFWSDALEVLAHMEGKETFSGTIRPSGLSVFEKMEQMDLSITSNTFEAVLCSRPVIKEYSAVVDLGKKMIARGYELSSSYYTTLFRTTEQVDEPIDLFNSYTSSRPVSQWNPSVIKVFLTQCAKKSDRATLVAACTQMVEQQAPSSPKLMEEVIAILLQEGKQELAAQYLRRLGQEGIHLDYKKVDTLVARGLDWLALFRVYTAALPATSWDRKVLSRFFPILVKRQEWAHIITTCNALERQNIPVDELGSFYIRALIHDGQSDEGLAQILQMQSSGAAIHPSAYRAIFQCRYRVDIPKELLFECMAHLGSPTIWTYFVQCIQSTSWSDILLMYDSLDGTQVDRKPFTSFYVRALLNTGKREEAMGVIRSLNSEEVNSLHESVFLDLLNSSVKPAEIDEALFLIKNLQASQLTERVAHASCLLEQKKDDWTSILALCNHLIDTKGELYPSIRSFYISALVSLGQQNKAVEQYRQFRLQGFKLFSGKLSMYQRLFKTKLGDAAAKEIFQGYASDYPVEKWEGSIVRHYLINCSMRKDWASIVQVYSQMIGHGEVGFSTFFVRALVYTGRSQEAVELFHKNDQVRLHPSCYRALFQVTNDPDGLFKNYLEKYGPGRRGWDLNIVLQYLEICSERQLWSSILELSDRLGTTDPRFETFFAQARNNQNM